MAAFVGRAPVAGDPSPFGIEFHHRRTQTDVELLTHQRIGHGVVVAFDLHVIVNVDPGELPLGILIGLRRQEPECRAIEGLKQLLAGARQLLEGASSTRCTRASIGLLPPGSWSQATPPRTATKMAASCTSPLWRLTPGMPC